MSGSSDMDMMDMAMPHVDAVVSDIRDGSCCAVAPAELPSSWLPKSELPTVSLAVSPALPDVSAITMPPSPAPIFLAVTPPTQETLCVFLN
jgi:hypothetical protein